MLRTEYGNFDGDKWQRICKICFLRKYDAEHYVEIPASPGDFGLEGFTLSGKAFQCYCPDQNYSASELYEKQRDKITKDLLKLKLNEAEIKRRIGSVKFDTWYFVTPQYRKNEILSHCAAKTEEVRGWSLSIIDSAQFNVVPVDIDFLHPFLATALSGANLKLNLVPKEPEEAEIVKYEKDVGYLVENAKRKHTKRVSQPMRRPEKINGFTHRTISDFLKGTSILERFRTLVPDEYERFVRVKNQETSDVEDLCASPANNHNQRYIDVMNDVETKMKSAFPNLDELMIKDLTNYVMADWILGCPLDFTDE